MRKKHSRILAITLLFMLVFNTVNLTPAYSYAISEYGNVLDDVYGSNGNVSDDVYGSNGGVADDVYGIINIGKYLLNNLKPSFTPPPGYHVISSKKSTIVPGVEETEIIYNTPDGQNPVSGFLVDINLGSSVNIMAASKDYNKRGVQTVRKMAEAAERETGRNIVAAINADLNWSGTGASHGPLIIDDTIHTDIPAPFFGIKKNGEAVIGDGALYSEIKHELSQAVKGMGWLVRDGEVVATGTSLAPRTAVGLRADGTVFFYVVEGRMFPRSVGVSVKDLAEVMRSYGAVMALNMDGGGSTTYLAKREGETKLELRNIPSDGTERESISSLLVYAEPGDGVFHHASISAEGDIYTPYSAVQFEARGVDSAGGFAELPANLTWSVVDAVYGTIDQTGTFFSNGIEGIVTVNLEDPSGRKVGEGSVEIRTPDDIHFRSDEFSLGFDESTDFGMRVTYQQRPVIVKEGDIIWEYDERLGVFENNIFTSNSEESVSGIVRATIANTNITKEFSLVVGKLPLIIFDFENDLINEKWQPSSVNGAQSSISIVHRDSGEPVRFGNQSLRLDFNFTTHQRNPSGAYAGFTDREGLEELGVTFELPGSPTGVGMWIYGTEEAQGLWLRTGIGVNGTTNFHAFNLTEELVGIDWLGWRYVEVSLTDYTGPYTILPGQFIRLMLTANSFGGQPLRPVGNIYVDNITVTYGTNIEDYHPPVIDSVKINDEEVYDGQVIHTNNITIETSFYEHEDKYATGIDYENVNIYVDGVNYLNQEGYALDITDGKAYLQNVFLTDGTHEIKIVVIDNAGNEAVEIRYITVDTGTNNKVYLESSDAAILGEDYVLELRADEIDNIDHVHLSLQISNTLANYELEFSDAFEGEVEYLNGVRLLNIDAQRVNDAAVDYVFKIKFPIDSNLSDSAVISYKVNIGEFKYVVDHTEGLFLKSFSAMPKTLHPSAPINITADIVLVGHEAVIYVTDSDGNGVENAEVFSVSSSGTRTSLGFTNEDGILITDEFSNEVVAFTLVAETNGMISFEYKGQSFDSAGDESGAPFNVTAQGVRHPESSKNITWFSNALADNQNVVIQYALKSDYDALGEEAWIEKEGTSALHAFAGSINIYDNYAVNINSVVIDGLASGEEYVYRVGNGEQWSDVRTFKTIDPYSDLNILVLGDVQTSNYAGFRNDLGRIAANGEEYNFAVQVGDLVDDAGTYSNWDGVLSAISESFLGDLDVIKVLGNHEFYGNESGDNAYAIFNLPNKGKKYYSTQYGKVYVAVIHYTMNRNELTEALEWLVEDANQSNAQWKILVTHQPPYYTNPEGGNEIIHELLPEYAETAGLDFVFSGHDHTYTRTKPLKNGTPDDDGVVYVVSGALGEKRYRAVNNPEFHFDVVNDTFSSAYLTVNVTDTTFAITAYETDTGQVLDHYLKTKESSHHDYDYYLVGDRVICYECNHSIPVSEYVGFAKTTDEEIIYLIYGQFYKGILVLGNDKYYFDEETGYAHTGHTIVLGLEAEFDENGRLISGGTGFVKEGRDTYYYQNLEMHKGWLTLGEDRYYFSRGSGRMETGVLVLNRVIYKFAADGRLIGEAEPGFIETEEGTSYVTADYIKLYGWQVIDGATYYFSTDTGFMRTGRTYVGGVLYDFTDDGKLIGRVETEQGFISDELGTYYVDENWKRLQGWHVIDGATYYFSTAYPHYMRTGRAYVDGVLYDFTADGKLIGRVEIKYGFISDEFGTYYVDENGEVLRGWQEINGATYYFSTDPPHYMRTGLSYVGGVLYRFTEDGKLIGEVQFGFISDEFGTYYVDENGEVLRGWQEIDGATYYFSTDSPHYMRTGRTIIGGVLYDFTEDGKLIGRVDTEQGFISDGFGTYYVDENWKRLRGWQEIDGATYYFSTDPPHYMRTGLSYVGGVLYRFTEDGKLIGEAQLGFISDGFGTYYVDENGEVLRGWQEINGATYYFSTDSPYYMRTGRAVVGGVLYDFTADGKLIGRVDTEQGFISDEFGTYYVDDNWRRLHGWQEIDGATYYFSTSIEGYMRTGLTYIGGVLYEFAEDGKLIGEVVPGN